jgi:hypothetical protein
MQAYQVARFLIEQGVSAALRDVAFRHSAGAIHCYGETDSALFMRSEGAGRIEFEESIRGILHSIRVGHICGRWRSSQNSHGHHKHVNSHLTLRSQSDADFCQPANIDAT